MSADRVVFVVGCALGLLALGIEIGQQHQTAVCPTVSGQMVVSTSDGHGVQTCVYANSYGRATRRVKL
jgi:hypothetical protein